MTDDRRLPYKDRDDDEVLAHPCVVCGIMVPTWRDPDYRVGQPVYCDKHRKTLADQ